MTEQSQRLARAAHISVRQSRRVQTAVLYGGITTCLLIVYGMARHPAAQARRGLASLHARNWERVQYEQLALAGMPAFAENGLLSGALKLEQGDLRPALRELQAASAKPSLRATALVFAGQAHYAQQRFRDAELDFMRALQLDPDLADAHRWLAIAYYDIGLMHEAVRHLQRVAELDPLDPRPHRVMAVIHMDHGGNALAVEDFQESLRRNPKQPDKEQMLLELAQTQVWLRRYRDAARTLGNCAESAEVCAMSAECAAGQGDRAAAQRWAERSLALDARQRLGLLVLSRLAFDDRDYRAAANLLSKAVADAPTDYNLRYSLMLALRAAGDDEGAARESESLEELRQLREEFDHLQTVVSQDPYNADLRYRLGELADRLGSEKMAESWFKAAVALNPQHRLAREELRKRGSAHLGGNTLLRGASL